MYKRLLLVNFLLFTNSLYSYNLENLENLHAQIETKKPINCKKFDLQNADLSGLNLTGANFSGADLSGIDFSDANLKGANFSKSKLCHTRFVNAQLSKANFDQANLTKADMTDSIINGSRFKKAKLSGIIRDRIKSAKGTIFEDERAFVQHLIAENKAACQQHTLSTDNAESADKLTADCQTVIKTNSVTKFAANKKTVEPKYILNLHGKMPLRIKYQRIDSIIKSAYLQGISQVEIIIGRGCTNTYGKMNMSWDLYNKHLHRPDLQPYIHHIKNTHKGGGWLINLKQASLSNEVNLDLIKSQMSHKKLLKQNKKQFTRLLP